MCTIEKDDTTPNTCSPKMLKRMESPVYDFWNSNNESSTTIFDATFVPLSDEIDGKNIETERWAGPSKTISLRNSNFRDSFSRLKEIKPFQFDSVSRPQTPTQTPTPTPTPTPTMTSARTASSNLSQVVKTPFTNEQRVQIVKQDFELQDMLADEVSKSGVVTAVGYQAVYQKFLTSDAVEQKLRMREATNGIAESEKANTRHEESSASTLALFVLPWPMLGFSPQDNNKAIVNEQEHEKCNNIAPRNEHYGEERDIAQSIQSKGRQTRDNQEKKTKENLEEFSLGNGSLTTNNDGTFSQNESSWLPWPERRASCTTISMHSTTSDDDSNQGNCTFLPWPSEEQRQRHKLARSSSGAVAKKCLRARAA